MTAFQKALMSHLEQTGLPVYLTGTVAPLPQFPYIALTVSASAFAGASPITATAWFMGRTANADRLALAQTLRQLIPEGGAKLLYQGGMSLLRRGSGDFLTLITDSTEPVSLGLRLRITTTCYDA